MKNLKVGDRVNVYGGIPGVTKSLYKHPVKGTVSTIVNDNQGVDVRLDSDYPYDNVQPGARGKVWAFYSWQCRKLKGKTK